MNPGTLNKLERVTLDEMAEAGLMNRIDTKYIAAAYKLEQLFEMAVGEYRVLEIENRRQMPYYTCYFDTEDTEMYYEHQRGRKARQKIRVRRYEGNDSLSFLEVKDKNNKGRTKKTRIEMSVDKTMWDYPQFLSENSNYSAEELIAHIENHFYRITLVRKDMSERVTIDTGIEFHNLITRQRYSIPDIAIIEWKRKSLSEYSPMKRFLKELGIRESGFSKYCVGMAMTNPELRKNRLKKKLRTLERIYP